MSDEITLIIQENPVEVVEVTGEGATVVVEVGSVGAPGPEGPAGPPGDVGTSRITLVAGQTLGGHRVVTYEGVYADPTNPEHVNRIGGITTAAALQNDEISVVFAGEIEELSWNWDTSKLIYLGASGTLVQTSPSSGFIRVLAVPITSTRILVDMREPIKL